MPAIVKTHLSFFSFFESLNADLVRIPPRTERIKAIIAEIKNNIPISNSSKRMKLKIIVEKRINKILRIKIRFNFLFFIFLKFQQIRFKTKRKKQTDFIGRLPNPKDNRVRAPDGTPS